MDVYDFIKYKIFNNLNKFNNNNNILIELDNILDINLIITIISKFLLCSNINNNFCNKCKNCNNINTNENIIIINNTNLDFNNIDYIKLLINNYINLSLLNYKFKLIFIYNINLLSNVLIDFFLNKDIKFNKYIRFIFICNNIKKIKLYFRISYINLILDDYNIDSNIYILNNIFKFNNYKNNKIALNLSNNSIIKSILLLYKNNWEKRLKFIISLESNILNKNLLFLFKILDFNEIEICNPIFWLLTFIIDFINYKNNFHNCIKNIDKIDFIKKISNIFSLNILNIILDKIIEYFYIINKYININKSFVLMKNILYIENIIK